ncbi:hypothetical protein A2U01_0064247, partial [Trifolium medium]|nr:hypothetical protein [Trifolium medium]
MESTSALVIQNLLNPLNLPPIATVGKSLICSGDTMKFNIGLIKIHPEKRVDFESLKINDFEIEELFINQGWK